MHANEFERVALSIGPFGQDPFFVGIEGLPEDRGQALLHKLFAHQGRDDFVYRHRWHSDMLLGVATPGRPASSAMAPHGT